MGDVKNPREGYCKRKVWGDGRGGGYQCHRKAKRDGYCTQHHPDTEAAREAERNAKYERESRRRNLRWAAKRALDALGDAALDGGDLEAAAEGYREAVKAQHEDLARE